MAEKALPIRIKPPRHYYSWHGDIPNYPGIGTEEAVDRVLHPSLEKRGLERVRIDDLRGLLEAVLRRNPDPDEFHRLYFNGIVINCFGDLRPAPSQ